MLAGAALRKTGSGWEFTSEAALEDFVWDNLHSLFGLTPLARQHSELGEFCDILAVGCAKQLTIIELKNTEDRYIVQQLTRYYDNLLQTKPFADKIDYNLPVELIAVAPSFHRHNHSDRKYTKLKIDFLQVTVTRKNQDFYLQLTNLEKALITEVQIPYQELDIATTSSNISAPPQLLLDWLGSCNGDEQQAIMKMREQILSFDERIKEEIEGKNVIRYKGKTKSVAEIYYQRTKSKLIIFLWLPTPTSWRKEVIGRIRLWLDGFKVTNVGHIAEGIGKIKLQSEWDAMPREKRPGNYYHNKYLAHNASIYSKFMQPNSESIIKLEYLTDLALARWRSRI